MTRTVDNETQEIVQKAAIAGMIGVFAASVRALLAPKESTWQRVRTFLAGVCLSILLGIILRNSDMSNFRKEVLIGTGGAFVATIWPVIEKGISALVSKWFTKKTDNVAGTNMD